ncbi:ISL3 family transposase [Micromonospora pisi]|uniref:ISL3 family transposase n=1 Tax=Micromonospora pisi TaxID=589240 RepID=UPI001B860337|nr:ISL3 family transposase [Micromonospora pisi]
MLPHLSGLSIEVVEQRDGMVVLSGRIRATTARCGRCRQPSSRIHGRYQRRLRDVAVAGMALVLQVQVRRFRCDNTGCPAKTFVEQVEGVTTPHARLTAGPKVTLTQIGLALAGRAGSRLAVVIGSAAGRDTLLRLVKALPDPPQAPITVLGVDDFAFRRGRHYGTVLIDMASHRPVDMFDGRDGDSLAAWLRQHPEIEVICRDRAGGYGEGARLGAPNAVQVADRFHLWQNLGQAVEKTVNAYRSRLASPAPPPADDTMPAQLRQLPELKIVTRLREHHAAVHELASQGWNKSAIARKLGLHHATVRKYLNAATAAELTVVSEQRAPGRRLRRLPAPALERRRTQRHPTVPRNQTPGLSRRRARCPALPAPLSPRPRPRPGPGSETTISAPGDLMDHDPSRPPRSPRRDQAARCPQPRP